MQIPKSHIALTIKTQLVSAEDITIHLGLAPYSFANKCEETRHISPGKVINTSLQKRSSWTHIVEIENSNIEKKLIQILSVCELKKIFIDEILENNGLIEIQIRLSGKNNVGDVLYVDTLQKLSQLGMSLSIEVFP